MPRTALLNRYITGIVDMLRTFAARNFRRFNQIDLELERFNLITGKNNVGKTSLLEAIFMLLAAHNPSKTLTIERCRGIEQFNREPKELWGWLFRNRDVDSEIEIQSRDDNSVTRKLVVSLKRPETIDFAPADGEDESDVGESDDINASTSTTESRKLAFDYQECGPEDTEYRSYSLEGVVKQEGISFEGSEAVYPNSIYVSSDKRPKKGQIERFSDLQDVGKEEGIVKILRILEDNLKQLKVSYSGKIPSLKADMGKGRLVPIWYLGDGVVNVLSMATEIASAPNGVVLIDEMDAGIHHSVMADVWYAIHELAHANDTQIIATTHSLDFVRAAYNVFSKNELDYFRLHRLDKSAERVRVATFESDQLRTAIELDMEIR